MIESRFAGMKKAPPPPPSSRCPYSVVAMCLWCTAQRLPATLPSHRYQTFASARNLEELGCNNWPPLSNQTATGAILHVAFSWFLVRCGTVGGGRTHGILMAGL